MDYKAKIVGALAGGTATWATGILGTSWAARLSLRGSVDDSEPFVAGGRVTTSATQARPR